MPDLSLLTLQRRAGNAAVTAHLQRLRADAPPRPAPISPRADPRFAALAGQVGAKSTKAKAHQSARAETAKAQKAALAPPGDKLAQAQAAQAEQMGAAKPAGFDKAGFIAAVKAAIAAQAPKNLDEADSFGSSGKADAVKGQVAGKVGEGKARSAEDIEHKTAAAPDLGAARDKPVTPLASEPTPALGSVDAGSGMPAPAPSEQTDFTAGKAQTDQKMADAGVTEEQLAKSNEPEFTDALAAKKEGEAHSQTAPGAVRSAETATLADAKLGATGLGTTGLAGLAAAKAAGSQRTAAGKGAAKTKDELARAEITARIQSIFDATKADVTGILGALDGKVSSAFESGERQAREAFTAQHTREMRAYKDARYAGVSGAARWVADKLTSLPAEANQIFVRAKAAYEARMEGVISSVADLIGAELGRAKDRIAQGRNEIKAFVAKQPRDLRSVANNAATAMQAQFEQLEGEVDAKRDALVQDLAAKYVEARTAVDAEITKAQDENKGLWDRAKEAIGGAIETVLRLKDMLLGVLARAAGAIEKIIKDPIAFLGNFVNAVKGGIQNFATNIWTHLKKGLQAWLFGALAEGGIELPEKFDLKGIVQLVLSILGLTWQRVRARIVAKIGEPAMALVEKGVDVVKILVTQGLGGLWTWVLERVGDIKEMVMSQIKEMVVTQIIKAGITWLISMLNPAGAFIKACKMIYDVVMFFVEKAAQIKEFVDAVLDSVESIAAGGVGAVASKVENTLAKMLPVLIGFLASLLGLGGISEKIKKIIETIQKPVTKVVDWVIGKAVTFGKKVLAGAKRLGAKLKKKLGIKDETPAQKQARLDKGVAAAVAAANRFAGKAVAEKLLTPILTGIRLRYRLKRLNLVSDGGRWAVEGEVNPVTKKGTKASKPVAAHETAAGKALLGKKITQAGVKRVFDRAPSRDQVKGQILEELMSVSGGLGSRHAKEAQAKEPAAEFIPGRRITDEAGKQLTDGIVGVLLDAGGTPQVKILKVFEAKAGEKARAKLAAETDRLSQASAQTKAELRKEIEEDLLAAKFPLTTPHGGEPTPQQERDHNAKYRPIVRTQYKGLITRRMKAKYQQQEPGQAVKTVERVLGSSIKIDRVSRRVVNVAVTATPVVGVLPKDTSAGKATGTITGQGISFAMARVGITAADLGSLTSAVIRDKKKT